MSDSTPRSLWELAGRPPMGGIVPSRRSQGWFQPISDLRRALKGILQLPPLRSWPSLWSVLHGTTPPPHVTWHALIGGIS
eukprot:572493-Heterocapsa_arctica.AAC.1